MRSVVLALHLLGFVGWMGGAFAAMTIGIAGRREPPDRIGSIIRLQAALYRTLVLPGSLLTVFSGLLLTMIVYGRPGASAAISHPLMVMQGAGLLAAIVTLVFMIPAAARLTRMAADDAPGDLIAPLRAKQIRAGMVSGGLGLTALISAALLR